MSDNYSYLLRRANMKNNDFLFKKDDQMYVIQFKFICKIKLANKNTAFTVLVQCIIQLLFWTKILNS